ncbi:hypothetical protein TKK_0012185 [Trichogramma kaykai]
MMPLGTERALVSRASEVRWDDDATQCQSEHSSLEILESDETMMPLGTERTFVSRTPGRLVSSIKSQYHDFFSLVVDRGILNPGDLIEISFDGCRIPRTCSNEKIKFMTALVDSCHP